MARINLTPERIRDFKTDKHQAFKWDSTAPGLAVRATSAGNKAFIFQGKLAGRSVRMTIGDVKAWGIDQARAEARRLQTLIDRGIDPRHDKADRLAATAARTAEARRIDATLGDAWSAYIAARRHKWSTRHAAEHETAARAGGEARKRGSGTLEAGPLAPLMPLKLGDVTPTVVADWLDAESARRPAYAALAYRLLRACLRWCAGREEFQSAVNVKAVDASIAKDHLPKAGTKDDCLQREQLRAWFGAVRDLHNPVIAAYLQALLITGARREELAGLTWENVDFQWRSLTIRDKVEGERTIPLTPYVAALLAALPRRNEWVFSSPAAASGRLQEPRIPHNKALTAAGLPHLSLHGLRRSFGTLAEWVECPVGIVAQIQGHKPSALAEKHYRRRPLDLLRMWHTKIEAWILNEAGIAQPAEQTPGLHVVSAA